MKKFLYILFAILLLKSPCFAVITTDEAVSENYIKGHGHSYEMAKLIDLQQAQINGTKTKFKNTDPDWYTSDKRINTVRKFFMYFDPALDDGKFMQNNIDYTNRWDDL